MSNSRTPVQPERAITGMLVASLYEGEEDLLTLHPANPPEDKRLSAWMTAEGDSYVSLAAWE
ncbi:hypothetical protein EGH24_12010 [Halonotius terrestris]|uniref:DUF7511 domain-containing protein n=1 Tax=Halonotius terrestris TaxID=2487750 RepID=A0A8J8TC19_9EURY|nr:hypothetical protein [Halonotius terrestris]TQQ79348.1 hypothetical protein EGH24_12010 [Halonotius terrestris]